MKVLFINVLGLLALGTVGCSNSSMGSIPDAKSKLAADAKSAPVPDAKSEIERLGGRIRVEQDGKQISVDFSKTGLKDADLAKLAPLLAALPDVEELDLTGTAVTADGLRHLKGIQSIKRIAVADALLKSKVVDELQAANRKLSLRGDVHPIGPLVPGGK